jgi:transposase InsO family protein
MGSKGDCYDNAVCELFHATLGKELLLRRSLHTRQEARTAIFEYIEIFHNRRRRHSSLGTLTPIEYELLTIPAA